MKYGVPANETPVACTACATTLSLEFGILSVLTGNPDYAVLFLVRAHFRTWQSWH